MTGLTTGATFWILPQLLPLELLNRYKNRREVAGACDANDTMSRWSDQLLLTAENDHFEGSMLLNRAIFCSKSRNSGVPKMTQLFKEAVLRAADKHFENLEQIRGIPN